MSEEKNQDEIFLEIAKNISNMSDCLRAHCGAVIVKDNIIISTGYNKSPEKQKSCSEIGYCFRNKYNIASGTILEMCRCAGSHAESNAIASASLNGISTKGATLYIYGNNYMCNICNAIVLNSGITNIIYKDVNGKINSDLINDKPYLTKQLELFEKIEDWLNTLEFETLLKDLKDYLYGCSMFVKDMRTYIILSMLIKNKLNNSVKKFMEEVK